MAILFVGIDLAKSFFAVHGVSDAGKPELVRPSVPRHRLLELIDERLATHARTDERAKEAATLLGVGPTTASAVAAASVGDFAQFANARQFGSWLGLAGAAEGACGMADSRRGSSQ